MEQDLKSVIKLNEGLIVRREVSALGRLLALRKVLRALLGFCPRPTYLVMKGDKHESSFQNKFVFAFQKLKYFSFFMAHFLHFITCAIYLGFEAMNIKGFC